MRLRRRQEASDATEAAPLDAAADLEAPGEGSGEGSGDDSVQGPFDVGEIDVDDDSYLDLGSLLVRPPEGVEVRLQVDEESGTVMAALLVAEGGLVELRAFAAPRNGDLWADVRRQIAADTAQHGGTASERSGPFGPELYCEMPVQLEDGSSAMQPSRVVGVNGPRWFLRAALVGAPALEGEDAGPWEDLVRTVVVRRGIEALPPGDALALSLPPDARRVE